MKKSGLYIIGGLLLIVVLIVLIKLGSDYKKMSDDDLKMYFFNAGKADACIIKKNNQYMMIDTGESSLSEEILKYFKDNNITKLDYLILTHFDKDHVGSASAIINNIQVDNILQSNYEKDSEEYQNYIDAIDAKVIAPKTINGDYSFKLGDMEVIVNGPSETFNNNESNNSSLITTFTYKNNSFIFMGDAQNGRIKEYLKNHNEKYTFMKFPYHGNYQKQLSNLLETMQPKYTIITSSEEEREDTETVNMLKNLNIKYYLTRNGALTVESNGKYINIEQ